MIVIDEKAPFGFVFVKIPSIMRGACNERLDEVDAEETEEVDEGSDEGDNGSDFGESDDVEGRGVPDLVAPPVQEVVGNGEK